MPLIFPGNLTMPNPHKLSRNAMLQHLREGRSIGYNGQTITTEAQLPSEAELAKGDPVAEEAAKVGLTAEIEALKARLASLEKSGPATQANTEPVKPPTDPIDPTDPPKKPHGK